MTYNLGAIGMGHWFERLQRSIQRGGRIAITKAVGLKSYEEKIGIMEKLGLGRENYFQINPGDPLPENFFQDIQLAYIASPNQFHASQILQCIDHGKAVVVEKTFGINKSEMDKVIDYIKKNNWYNKVHLHLHYLRKALTMSLPSLLVNATREYGKVISVAATFFEQENAEDRRRTWILKPESGGIFLDWIHPIEVLYKYAGAEFADCRGVETFIIRPEYDGVNPTAVQAVFNVKGRLFADSATVTIRVGKGFPHGVTCKTIRFYLETDAFLEINYADSEQEYNSDFRGTWQLWEVPDGKPRVVEGGIPSGATPYELLVRDIINMLEGGNNTMTIEDIQKIYEPQWKFQDVSKNVKPVSNESAIKIFIKAGIEKTSFP
ncbi:MAG: Gfo/Idh/MocA family oxidoreductase [Candidatus Aenigmarchaeota archaeon]|nr:Gfo/Idh/MocA family oxidoreductase [Candidatus Aenigmarchaeota archaeon]